MHFQVATSLLAGCVAQAVAGSPAAIVNNAAVSSPITKDLFSTPTTNNNKAHRLLKKFKERRQRAVHAEKQRDGESSEADVGVLSTKNTPRFLQENDYDYYCPRDTCPDELCDCAEKGGSLEECTSELQSVCRTGSLSDCVFAEYVKVYEEVYCPFVSCVGEGFRENQCDCAFYELYCDRLQGEECTPSLQNANSDDPDKKPFFGCDETELDSVCAEATSCKGRGDLQGLPEMGTWKNSVRTKPNSGERIGGASVVAGVTMLSMLWLMMNV